MINRVNKKVMDNWMDIIYEMIDPNIEKRRKE
jgi:hypothetical protein